MNRRRTRNKSRRRRRRGLAWRFAAWAFRALIDYWKRSRAAYRRCNKQRAEKDIRGTSQILPPTTADRQGNSFREGTIGRNRRSIEEPKINDAISALRNLGYRQPQAAAAIAAAARSAGEGADIATLIRLGLKGLAK